MADLAKRPQTAKLGNLNAAKHPWRSFLRRRVLIHPDDRAILRLVETHAADLLEDKGPSATAGEVALIRNAQLAEVAALMCLREIGRSGDFSDAEGGREASTALRELPKFLSAHRGAVQALGIERRAQPAVSFREILEAEVVSK